jgi:hypothetical protein
MFGKGILFVEKGSYGTLSHSMWFFLFFGFFHFIHEETELGLENWVLGFPS